MDEVILQQIWDNLIQDFFPSTLELKQYKVLWSSRNQKRTLASCNIVKKKVRVAKELNRTDCLKWLSPLLYHEMCHAYLGFEVKRFHGHEFKQLEKCHPLMSEFKAWVKNGGWQFAVRSDRAKQTYARREVLWQAFLSLFLSCNLKIHKKL